MTGDGLRPCVKECCLFVKSSPQQSVGGTLVANFIVGTSAKRNFLTKYKVVWERTFIISLTFALPQALKEPPVPEEKRELRIIPNICGNFPLMWGRTVVMVI